MKEQDNTSTARIKPPRKVFQPIYINLEDLEAIREIEGVACKQTTPSNTSGAQK